MKSTIKKTVIAMCCTAALLLTACNSDDDKNIFQEKVFVAEKAYQKDSLEQASKIQIMTYLMPNVLGQKTKATAMVMFPKTAQPAAGWPVVVWAHGTTGVGDECAPSNNLLNSNFEILANSLLKEGYVIVAPDYEGLGVKGIHPYLHLSSAAQSAIHAIKSVHQAYPSRLNKSWMSVGQSQGGHASLGIAQYANNDPYYKGAVATAPASSLGYIITQVAPKAISAIEIQNRDLAIAIYSELLAYAAYTGVGIKAYEPRFSLATIFQSRSQAVAEKAEGSTGENGLCLMPLIDEFRKDIKTYLESNSTQKVMDYPGLKVGFENDPVVSSFLSNNQPGTQKLMKPVYVVQGENDTAVPYQVTQQLVNQLNGLGTQPPIVLDMVAGASHTQAIVEKNDEVVDFIKSYLPVR